MGDAAVDAVGDRVGGDGDAMAIDADYVYGEFVIGDGWRIFPQFCGDGVAGGVGGIVPGILFINAAGDLLRLSKGPWIAA